MNVIISNPQLQMTFALADGKFVWQSLKSASGTEFLTQEQPPLWEVEFLDARKGFRVSLPIRFRKSSGRAIRC